MDDKGIKEYIKKSVDRYKYSFIPLRLAPDKGELRGKSPAIRGWQKYCDELPTDEEIDNWNIFGDISGVGICCGPASNLGCIDIDAEDEELNRRLVAIMPRNAARIMGNPNRGGKFLFKLRDCPSDPILKIQNVSKIGGCVEVFIGNKQIVVPPSKHTQAKDGSVHSYSWYDGIIKNGFYPIIDELPLLDSDILDAITFTFEGQAPSEVAMNFPPGAIDLTPDATEGRWEYMRRRMSELQRNKCSIDEAVKILVAEDVAKNGPDNLVFLTKTKNTASMEINCLKWYVDQLVKNNRNKTIYDCEVPLSFTNETKRIVSSNSDWCPPDIPNSDNIIIEPFDLSIVPDVWRDLVGKTAESMSVPAEACFFILLTELSSLIGNKKVITGKIENKSWEEAHNIWSIFISKSGTRKTPLLRQLKEPMRRIQKNIKEDHDKKSIEVAKLKEVIDPQIKELESRLKQESIIALDESSHNEHVIEALQIQLDALRKSIEEPAMKQLIINSVTTEKLHDILTDNPTGSMVTYNEISELLNQFKKKGYESHKQLIMDSWDGLDDHMHQTKSGGDSYIEKACLALYGAIQPSLFMEHINEIYQNKNDDGFWQRPFIIFNDTKRATKAIDMEFNHNKYNAAYEVFFKAYDLESSDTPVGVSSEVRDEILAFEDKMNTMSFTENSDAIGSFWGKFTGKIVKVASLIEFIKNEGKFTDKISMGSIKDAIYIMNRQINHIKNIFPKETADDIIEIVDLMRSGIIQNDMNMRELGRNHSKYFSPNNIEKKNRIIRELHSRHIMKVNKEGKSTKISISPYIF